MEQIEQEEIIPFADGNFLMKNPADNKWYVTNSDLQILTRYNREGQEEPSVVDLQLDDCEIAEIKFGSFLNGIMIAKVSGKNEYGHNVSQYNIISPSGFVDNWGNVAFFSFDELDFRSSSWYLSQIMENPISFKGIRADRYNSLDKVDVHMDVAKYALLKQYDAFEAEAQEKVQNGKMLSYKEQSAYKKGLDKFVSTAELLKMRYAFLIESVSKRIEKRGETLKKQEQGVKDLESVRQRTKEAMDSLFKGPSNNE